MTMRDPPTEDETDKDQEESDRNWPEGDFYTNPKKREEEEE